MGSEGDGSAGSGNWVPSAAGVGDSSLWREEQEMSDQDHSTLSKRDHQNAVDFRFLRFPPKYFAAYHYCLGNHYLNSIHRDSDTGPSPDPPSLSSCALLRSLISHLACV